MLYRWAPERQARVGVMPREGTAADIRWFEVQPCYVFHPLNAYDDGDRVAARRRASPVGLHHRAQPGSQQPVAGPLDGRPCRAGRLSKSALDDTSSTRASTRGWSAGDTGTGTRVGYAPGTPDFPRPTPILRHDLSSRRTQSVAFGPGREPGEFVFGTSTPDAAEDDGVAIGFVYTRRPTVVPWCCWTGRRWKPSRPCVFRRVPHGFHGNSVPECEHRPISGDAPRGGAWHWLSKAYVVGLCGAAMIAVILLDHRLPGDVPVAVAALTGSAVGVLAVGGRVGPLTRRRLAHRLFVDVVVAFWVLAVGAPGGRGCVPAIHPPVYSTLPLRNALVVTTAINLIPLALVPLGQGVRSPNLRQPRCPCPSAVLGVALRRSNGSTCCGEHHRTKHSDGAGRLDELGRTAARSAEPRRRQVSR